MCDGKQPENCRQMKKDALREDDNQPSLAATVSELVTLVEFGRCAAICSENRMLDEIDWMALFDMMFKHADTARQLVLFGKVDQDSISSFLVR